MLDQKTLLELLSYDPSIGKLFWRARAVEMFPDARSCKLWNTKFANKEAFTSDHSNGYNHGSIFNKQYLKHRVIWCMCFGYWPINVDHIDGNRKNCCLINLREVSSKQNQQNRGMISQTFSNVMGVYFDKRRNNWVARITVDGKEKHLGSFADKESAAFCRKNAEIVYGFHVNHGEQRNCAHGK